MRVHLLAALLAGHTSSSGSTSPHNEVSKASQLTIIFQLVLHPLVVNHIQQLRIGNEGERDGGRHRHRISSQEKGLGGICILATTAESVLSPITLPAYNTPCRRGEATIA